MIARVPAWALGLMRATCAATGPAMPSTSSVARRPIVSAADVLGRERRLDLDLRQVDDLDQPGVDRDPFAGCAMRCATRPEIGATRVASLRLLRASADRRQRRLVAGPRAGLVGDRGLQAGRRDEALRHQGAVVLERALRDVELRLGRRRRSARPGCSFSSSSVVSSWPSTWPARTAVAFAHRQRLDLGGDPRPDDGAVDRLQPARDLERARQVDACARPGRRSGARSRPPGAFADAVCAACSALRATSARATKPPSATTATTAIVQPCQRFIAVRRCGLARRLRLRRLGAGGARRPRLQAVQHQVDLGCRSPPSGRASRRRRRRRANACSSPGRAAARPGRGPRSRPLTWRNSPRSMPRCTISAIIRSAGEMTSST